MIDVWIAVPLKNHYKKAGHRGLSPSPLTLRSALPDYGVLLLPIIPLKFSLPERTGKYQGEGYLKGFSPDFPRTSGDPGTNFTSVSLRSSGRAWNTQTLSRDTILNHRALGAAPSKTQEVLTRLQGAQLNSSGQDHFRASHGDILDRGGTRPYDQKANTSPPSWR
ncbi:hypothetical protein GWK47_048062 [Chionoecetes opilio]|uniref:Uncharacterized protein n=1 Tax=Chionoecetes opilio TaxID=41210 RepID=A0A8J5CV70_CHIOP|nr:hypothetical protein GWK47_048062 [Chionoecetes opilio]